MTTLAAELPRRSETLIVLVEGTPDGSFNIMILSFATALLVVGSSEVFLALSVMLNRYQVVIVNTAFEDVNVSPPVVEIATLKLVFVVTTPEFTTRFAAVVTPTFAPAPSDVPFAYVHAYARVAPAGTDVATTLNVAC